MSKVALIDGDSIIYILSWQFKDQDPVGDAYDQMRGAVESFVDGILSAVNTNRFVGAIGYSQARCFRYTVANYKPYKGTRKEKDEWVVKWENVIRDRLLELGFITIPTLEADDIVALGTTVFKDYIICSPDKDLNTLPGPHFDYKKTEFGEITPVQADWFFHYQMLIGDSSDNVAGLPGVGEKKAKEKLSGEDFPEQIVRKEYNKYFGNHYGNIIFEENKSVLGLVTPGHEYYHIAYSNIVEAAVQTKEISSSQPDVFRDLPGAD